MPERHDEITWPSWIPERWWAALLQGVLAILFGIALLARPGITLLFFVYLFGIYAILSGISDIWMGITGKRSFLLMLLLGAIDIFAGIIALSLPGITLFAFVVIVGAWAITRGMVLMMTAIGGRAEENAWLFGVSGTLSVVFGIFLLAWPMKGLAIIVLLMGIYWILHGLTLTFMSFQVKHMREARH